MDGILIILKYKNCGYAIFRNFAILLEDHKQLIINSFINLLKEKDVYAIQLIVLMVQYIKLTLIF